MNKCTGCGRELSWPYKTCNDCAIQFFEQVYTPAVPQPVCKLSHCSNARCGQLAMCVQHSDGLFYCDRCKAAVQSVQLEKIQTESEPKPAEKVQLAETPRKELADRPSKPRTNRLSVNVSAADRKIVLAKRAWEYLQDAGGKLWLSQLARKMNAYRYPDWRSAWGLLITVGAAAVQGARHRQLVLISANPFYRWRLPRRRKHKARSRGRSEWFQARFG